MTTSSTPDSADISEPSVAALVADGSTVGAWTLDSAGSRVEFHSTSMWGMAKIHGRFDVVSGTATVGPEGAVTGSVVIETASLDTKMSKRDKHLRSEDFFDVTRYPTATYSVDSVLPLDGNLVDVTGTLTVRDRSEPLPFSAKVTEATPEAVTIEAELTVDRSQFGMLWRPLKVASLDNRVVVTARFQRVAEPAAD